MQQNTKLKKKLYIKILRPIVMLIEYVYVIVYIDCTNIQFYST